jgi:hypothetical protein
MFPKPCPEGRRARRARLPRECCCCCCCCWCRNWLPGNRRISSIRWFARHFSLKLTMWPWTVLPNDRRWSRWTMVATSSMAAVTSVRCGGPRTCVAAGRFQYVGFATLFDLESKSGIRLHYFADLNKHSPPTCCRTRFSRPPN